MALDKVLLEKIRNNDTTLTLLNLGDNQIGDSGALLALICWLFSIYSKV